VAFSFPFAFAITTFFLLKKLVEYFLFLFR